VSKLKIGEYDFTYIETISPLSKDGQVVRLQPQSRYKNVKNLDLHEYGSGDFCKFKLLNAKDTCGVYAWVIQGETRPIYIGETTSFKKRFNMGYGNISPKNCFIGGQRTNCKMNKVVLQMYSENKKIDIYFLETTNYKKVEEDLLRSIETPYNVKNNRW